MPEYLPPLDGGRLTADQLAPKTITALLRQAEWWRTRDGMPIRLTSMEPSHRVNLLAFLRRRSATLREHYFWSTFRDAPGDVFAEAEMEQLTEHSAAWLERQPLIIELARLVKMDESIEGEIVPGPPLDGGRLPVISPGPTL